MSSRDIEQFNKGVSDPIREIREVVARARAVQIQGLSGFAIEAATYEATTNPLNQQLLDGFMNSLPIRRVLTNYSVDQPIVKQPHDVIPSLAYLVGYDDEYGSQRGQKAPTGFVIGERVDAVNPKRTHILFAYQSLENHSTWVRPGTVLTQPWSQKRDAVLERMRGSTSENELSRLYEPTLKSFKIPVNRLLFLKRWSMSYTGCFNHIDLMSQSSDSKFKRVDRRDPLLVGFARESSRAIRAEDFLEYNVMYNLEILAAAFGIEVQFDTLKAERASKAPPSPEETTFGLNSFREVVEQVVPRGIAKYIQHNW